MRSGTAFAAYYARTEVEIVAVRAIPIAYSELHISSCTTIIGSITTTAALSIAASYHGGRTASSALSAFGSSSSSSASTATATATATTGAKRVICRRRSVTLAAYLSRCKVEIAAVRTLPITRSDFDWRTRVPTTLHGHSSHLTSTDDPKRRNRRSHPSSAYQRRWS